MPTHAGGISLDMNALRRASIGACAAGLAALLVAYPGGAGATPPLEWSLRGGRDMGYRPSEDVNQSVAIARPSGRDYAFATNYNYFFELRQIAAFLQAWQEDDAGSPDFGGMIEAEAGELADVIQTDNTLEAIIAWSKYAQVFGDTMSYGENIRRAWSYCWRYPAWREEGDPGDDYYRNHNCAWGLWATTSYQDAYGDASHAAYADTCAAYMVAHPMSFSAPGSSRWINPFVTGWMAGNLYLYGEAVGSAALMDTAAGMGARVREWIEADPQTRLSEERWAMSSGTAVWGVCTSEFRADPQQGTAWIEEYGPLVDTFQPWRNAPDDGYDWDNSWNVAYANAHHAMYVLSDNGQYGANFQALTDTLLSYDTDDDGGIMATTQDPPTEDMTWVSTYLWLMGVHNLSAYLPDTDVGVLRLSVEAVRPPFHAGDSLLVQCTFANFGRNPQSDAHMTVALVDPAGAQLAVAWSGPVGQGENVAVETVWPLAAAGAHDVEASSICTGDVNALNDTLSLSVDVLPVVSVQGRLLSALTGGSIPGHVAAAYLGDGQLPAPYDSTWADPADGSWRLDLPGGSYALSVLPRLPYPELTETLTVGSTSVEELIVFDRIADVVLVDDDDGDDIEGYILDSCDSLALEARRWDRWTAGVPAASDLIEFPSVPVIWLTGEAAENSLEPAEQDTLRAFCGGGGLVLLSGQNAVEYGATEPFFADMFPVTFGGNSFDHILDLDPEDPFNATYAHIGTAGFGSANNQRSQDILIPGSAPGVEQFTFVSYGPGQVAGIRFEGGGGRRILLGFGLEGVGLPSQPQGFMPRHVLLSRCLAWMRGIVDSPDAETPLVRVARLGMHPNPVRDKATVTFWSPTGAHSVPFRMYDAAGREVASALLVGASSLSRVVMDMSALPAGSYVCRAGAAAPRELIILR
ncbi:MAG: hypothetical protein MUE60_08725 [Candidatus Eisenbacteria bacterium]|nr:hypothetical protein [Candidatus Eisenbacteria bacterium]